MYKTQLSQSQLYFNRTCIHTNKHSFIIWVWVAYHVSRSGRRVSLGRLPIHQRLQVRHDVLFVDVSVQSKGHLAAVARLDGSNSSFAAADLQLVDNVHIKGIISANLTKPILLEASIRKTSSITPEQSAVRKITVVSTVSGRTQIGKAEFCDQSTDRSGLLSTPCRCWAHTRLLHTDLKYSRFLCGCWGKCSYSRLSSRCTYFRSDRARCCNLLDL